MRRWFAAAGVAFAMLAGAATAQGEVPDGLKSACVSRTPHPGYSFQFCTDGNTPTFGRTANNGGVRGIRVPASYDGFEGLPAKAADATSVPGADAEGFVTLDVDISLPTGAAPPGGFPLVVFMHGCCAGDRGAWERDSFDSSGEHWHYNNGWFASRGYVVINYTARGFRNQAGGGGSTGETQLDSRRFEINDFQHLAGVVADDPFFNVNPQKVVATGGSYGGGFAWMALTDPKWTSPGGKDLKLAAVAPRYGWTDIVYALIPNGHHSQYADDLPAFDGSDTTTPFGIPKQSINSILYGTGQFGATFPSTIDQSFLCLFAPEPFEDAPQCEVPIRDILPEFIRDRSAYYQNHWFQRIASDPSYRVPIFNAATFTDPLFTPVENLRMSNRIQALVPGYPIQQYFGDYQHFVQNKAKEWGDLCGADHHVCRFDEYPGGNLNAAPAGLYRTGVNTLLNRFIDHHARPSGNPSEPAPRRDVTAALQVCPQNATAEFPADEPGATFTARRFFELAPHRLRIDIGGTQTTTNEVEPNPHATQADPLNNVFLNGGRCPVHTAPAGTGVAVYDSEPLAERATMLGATKMTVDYTASTARGVQLNARLYDVLPDGTQVMVDRGPYRVESLTGPATFELHGNGWRFEPGHRIRLELTQDDSTFLKTSEVASTIAISGVHLRIPVREQQPPVREDYRNAAKFCKADRAFLGDEAFRQKYGTGKHGANAHGKCVSANA
ncbi:MAG: CocE/NonD family hydrolase C-terminal non-catalytic domain-containing protein [Solirubrobacterales bacterium]